MSTAPSLKQTTDQRRAAHAWDAVQAAKKNLGAHKDQDPEEFRNQARKMPVRIMTSGLGQALAFLTAKGYAPGLLVELADWVLNKRHNPESQCPKPSDTALLEKILQGDADFLRWATDETLAYLQWLNRFAEAEIPAKTPSQEG